MILLYQYPAAWGLPSVSPFCMKVETYLRMANIPYQVKMVNNAHKAPKGKLPYIQDEERFIADSSIIVDYLENSFDAKLDGHLTPMQRAEGLMLQRMLEEHLYWVMMYTRWIEPNGWTHARKAFFGRMPLASRKVVSGMQRKQTIKSLYYHGLGRHDRDDIYAFANRDLSAISYFLGDKVFMLGDKLSSIDACAYAFLANILWSPIESPLKDHLVTLNNLRQYCDRIKQLFYPSFTPAVVVTEEIYAEHEY